MRNSLFLIFASFFPLFGGEQLLVVSVESLEATQGELQRYENQGRWIKAGDPIPVTLGRSGLGYASGNEPLKREGDGRTPAGVFAITETFGYDDVPNSRLPYRHADEKLICVDDADDPLYNRIVSHEGGERPKSYERMRREDDVYRHGAVIGYNAQGEKGRGSCIFLHINHPDRHPTSGCTAMDEEALKEVLRWLDPQKQPVIVQMIKSECREYRKRFEGIECD